MDLENTPFHKIAEDMPEGSVTVGRWAIVHYIGPDGGDSWRWENDGDEDTMQTVAALEHMKFQVFHHSIGQCEHGD